MRVLVVYESMFGNTERIARAVGEGLAEYAGVEVADVDTAATGPAADVDLLVTGGPTHAWGMSRPGTRKGAANQSGKVPIDRRIGLREWLESLPRPRSGGLAAAFDTRFAKPTWLTGSAARRAAIQLRRRGYRMALEPESFFVTGTDGPLVDGEVERAKQWGTRLGTVLVSAPR